MRSVPFVCPVLGGDATTLSSQRCLNEQLKCRFMFFSGFTLNALALQLLLRLTSCISSVLCAKTGF